MSNYRVHLQAEPGPMMALAPMGITNPKRLRRQPQAPKGPALFGRRPNKGVTPGHAAIKGSSAERPAWRLTPGIIP